MVGGSEIQAQRVERALNFLCTACKDFCTQLTDLRSEIKQRQHAFVLADQEAVQNARDEGKHVLTITLDKFSSKEQHVLKEKYRTIDAPEPEYTETVHVRIDKRLPSDDEVCKNGLPSNPSISSLLAIASAYLFPVVSATESCTPLPRFAASTDAEETWEVAKTWLDKCLTEHACSNSKQQRKMPTRLLKIQDDGEGIRLCRSDELEGVVKYATLSHCVSGSHSRKTCHPVPRESC